MKMFHAQPKICEKDKLPLFRSNKNELKDINLIQATLYCRDGKQRLPTPDKIAIMELSTSFQKRRLGKQQRILSDITKRCREQDITDLSIALSSRCCLKHQGDAESKKQHKSKSSQLLRRPQSDPAQNSRDETTYKSFPTRKIYQRIRYDIHQQSSVQSRSRSVFNTGKYSRANLRNSPRKRTHMWAVPTSYNKLSERFIFSTSRIDPEPRSKTRTDFSFYNSATNPQSSKSSVTKDELTIEDTLSDVRQQ